MFFQSESLQWFAIQVRSNHEKIANAILEQKGFRTFLPLYRTQSSLGGRTKILERPLFPGYLFCFLDAQRRHPVVTVSCIVRIVGVGKTPVPVDAAELGAVHSVVSSNLPFSPHRYMRSGEMVRISEGPLRGMQGLLDQEQGGDSRVIVSVNLIRQSIAVNVDRSNVIPMMPPPVHEGALGVWRPGRCFG